MASASTSQASDAAPTAEAVAKLARAAFEAGSLVEADERVSALRAISRALGAAKDEILAANARDVDLARQAVAKGTMSATLLKRLDLSSSADKYDRCATLELCRGVLNRPAWCRACRTSRLSRTPAARCVVYRLPR